MGKGNNNSSESGTERPVRRGPNKEKKKIETDVSLEERKTENDRKRKSSHQDPDASADSEIEQISDKRILSVSLGNFFKAPESEHDKDPDFTLVKSKKEKKKARKNSPNIDKEEQRTSTPQPDVSNSQLAHNLTEAPSIIDASENAHLEDNQPRAQPIKENAWTKRIRATKATAPEMLCTQCKHHPVELAPPLPPPRTIQDATRDARKTWEEFQQLINIDHQAEISKAIRKELNLMAEKFAEHFREIEQIDKKSSKSNKEKMTPVKKIGGPAAGPSREPLTKPALKDVVKRTIQSTCDSKPKDNVLIIEMGNDLKAAPEPKKALANIIKAKENKIEVKSVKVTGEKIIIVTNKREHADIIRKNSELSKKNIIREPTKRLPRMVIYNVPSEIKKEELIDTIAEQNPRLGEELGDLKKVIKPAFQLGKKDMEYTHWVVEMQPEVRNILLKKDKLYIYLNSCRVKDFTSQTKCYKCFGFGHIANKCNASASTCGHCAMKGHIYKDCPNRKSAAKCANCARRNLRSDHSVQDSSCPSYQKYIKTAIGNTLYKRS